jgi:uncharacterized membrane protein YfhO
MLNTKYIISGNLATDTIPNPKALGNAWFIQNIAFENGANAVMKKLDSFNPATTAVIDTKDKSNDLSQLGTDSTGKITLIANNNDDILYKSNSNEKQFAVFSEIYYNLGWKAYVDGKETAIYQTNYVLRGIVIPAGAHEIKFEFKPTSINVSRRLSDIASFIIWISLFAGIVLYFKSRKTTTPA